MVRGSAVEVCQAVSLWWLPLVGRRPTLLNGSPITARSASTTSTSPAMTTTPPLCGRPCFPLPWGLIRSSPSSTTPGRGQRVHMALRGLDQARRSHPRALILDLDEFVHVPATVSHRTPARCRRSHVGMPSTSIASVSATAASGPARPAASCAPLVRRQPDLTHVTRVLLRSNRLSLETPADGAPIWT